MRSSAWPSWNGGRTLSFLYDWAPRKVMYPEKDVAEILSGLRLFFAFLALRVPAAIMYPWAGPLLADEATFLSRACTVRAVVTLLRDTAIRMVDQCLD